MGHVITTFRLNCFLTDNDGYVAELIISLNAFVPKSFGEFILDASTVIA